MFSAFYNRDNVVTRSLLTFAWLMAKLAYPFVSLVKNIKRDGFYIESASFTGATATFCGMHFVRIVFNPLSLVDAQSF
jgi:hypothetical protein